MYTFLYINFWNNSVIKNRKPLFKKTKLQKNKIQVLDPFVTSANAEEFLDQIYVFDTNDLYNFVFFLNLELDNLTSILSDRTILSSQAKAFHFTLYSSGRGRTGNIRVIEFKCPELYFLFKESLYIKVGPARPSYRQIMNISLLMSFKVPCSWFTICIAYVIYMTMW